MARLAGPLLPTCKSHQQKCCGLFPVPLEGKESKSPGALGTRAREGITLDTSLQLHHRGGWDWLLDLSWGNYAALGGSWTSMGSWGGLTHTHSMGKEKAHRPEGITQPSVTGARPTLQEWNRPWA